MKLTIVGGGGFRVPLVYGALLAKRDTLPFDEVVLHDLDAGRMERMAAVLRGLAAGARRRAAVPRHDRPRRRRRGRRLRVLRDPRRPARGPGGRRVGAARARRARAGDHRAGRHLLRAAHDPGDARLAETIAERAPGAWVINFTNPAGMVTEALQQVLGDRVVGICDSPSGLCRRVARARRQRARRDVVRLLRPQPPRLAAAAYDADGDRLPELLADDEHARRLRGGPPVRRRLAARARDDPERVPLLLLLPRRRGRVDPRAASRAARSCSSRRPSSTPATARTPSPTGAPPAPSATAPTWPAERLAAGIEADHDDGGDGGGYEGEAMAVVEAIANNTRAIMILNTANRSALPFLDERAVVEVPCIVGRTGPVPVAIGAVPAARAGARHRDQGRRAHDDRGGPDRLRRARGARARAAPAGAERAASRATSSPATASGSPSCRSASPHERRRRRHRHRVHGHHVHRARVGARARARSASPATSCARPAAAPSTRSASPGSGCAPRSRCRSARTSTARFIREALEREGIELSTGAGTRTPTTVVMP